MRIGDALPTLDGATDWLNGSHEEVVDLVAGKPTLVHFWAVSCGICKDKMPQLRGIVQKYSDQGLQTVAIHMPRYEADTNMETVKEAVAANSINETCAIDSLHKLKDAFQNEQGWVPVYFLFDAEGKLKTRAAGEFGINVLQNALDKMFPEQTETAAA